METKCAAFWVHTNIRSDNRVFPCCRFKSPIDKFDGDLSTVLNSNAYNVLRKASLENNVIQGCEKCYYEESVGKESLRQKFNKEYLTDKVSLQFLEIGFDNICNLTCDGCWEEFSSSWGRKVFKLKSDIIKSTKEITCVPDSITKVLFLGGEPLMTNRHKTFLLKFKNLSDLEVVYNTNGTFLLDEVTVELLKKCKTVNFIVSIDGFGKLNETVRSGSKWKDVIDFLNQLSLLGFNFTIHTVIHINNWQGLDDLSKFITKNNYTWTTNILTYPIDLRINISENKKEIAEYIQKIDVLPNKETIIKYILE
jgi:sulfatase maturation enzyme AslB (radical SAM superfamily)